MTEEELRILAKRRQETSTLEVSLVVGVTVTPAQKAAHAARARDARLSLATLDLFGNLASLGGTSMAEAVVGFLNSWMGDSDTS